MLSTNLGLLHAETVLRFLHDKRQFFRIGCKLQNLITTIIYRMKRDDLRRAVDPDFWRLRRICVLAHGFLHSFFFS